MYSDNGTQFTAANKDLNEQLDILKNMYEELKTSLTEEGITWNFIPAKAPHFGGLWESGVKAVKFHLKRMIGDLKLTFEQFYTVLTQIEAILNSRPLTPLTSDPDELEVLTPSHFLIGRTLTSVPDPDVTEIAHNRLSLFQQLQKIQQNFWRRWKREYLAELQVRVKWNKHQTVLQEGTMVILKDENLPPLRWQLGRVTEVIPGIDGVSRVAIIRTKNGTVKRAFSKLCPLPIEDTNKI